MRHLSIIPVLIAALLACPCFCRAGVGGCCATATCSNEAESAPACPADCCRHLDKSKSHPPAPPKLPCEKTCLCKGALPEVSEFDLGTMLLVWCELDGSVNDAGTTEQSIVRSPPGDSPSPLAGRALRAEFCSWLC